MSLNLSASNIDELNNAIKQVDADATSGNADTITLSGSISLDPSNQPGQGTALEVINLHSGVTLNIIGNNNALDGGGWERGLFVYSGKVTIDHLTISNMLALGGTGNNGGGGGGH